MNPSPVFQLWGRLEGSGSRKGKGSYYYRAEASWTPTERLSLSATRASNLTGDRRDELSASLTWKVNRAIDFNVNYSHDRSSSTGDFSQSLMFRFLARF